MSDRQDNETRRDVPRPNATFITRLIPAVATMTLTLTACPTPELEKTDPPGNGPADGRVTPAEIRSFCEQWRGCDPSAFEDSYNTTDECVSYFEEAVEYQTSYVEQYYGSECLAEWEASMECQLRAFECVAGEFDATGGNSCYELVSDSCR